MRNRTSKSTYKGLFIRMLLLFSLLISVSSASTGFLAPAEIIKLLQKGGYILYIRHTTTDHSQQDKDLSDLTNCALQRNLSPQGITESKIIGSALKSLDIEVDGIYTSPYCRCVDTAKIAFGRYNIIYDMRATLAVNQKESTRIINVLEKQLSRTPKPGFNTVLVSHSTNLRELTKIWPKPEGVIHIFKPLGDKGYRHIGHIKPTEWSMFVDID